MFHVTHFVYLTLIVVAFMASGLPPATVLAEGSACTYDPGIMTQVAETRQLSLVGTLGGVALLEREHLGKRVYLERPDGVIEGPFRVVDYWCAPPWCPEGATPPPGWAVDVGWETWARWRWLRQEPHAGGCLPGIRVLHYSEVLPGELVGYGHSGLIE